ncbi:DUF3297 family protein [Sphingomonas sp.]|uniref:DUF3297 family protein n=1 Tax=Sphingomonas sp. TaxID=28214 RepID=UPI00286A2D02|nr:DUF3297 family protein [Sphingomonas sp.]
MSEQSPTPPASASEPPGPASTPSTASLPDRLSLDPRSPHFDGDMLQQGVRINFNGVEKTNVEEYCVSEGWIKVAAGRSRDRKGNPMTLKLKGVVEPFVGVAGSPDEEPGIE